MRYIDAYKLRQKIKKHENVDKALALTLVNSTLTEDVHRYGEWRLLPNGRWECQICFHEMKKPEKFCGGCGARLRCWWEKDDDITVRNSR